MDPTYLGLMQHVLADPADDTPRLVLADWLDEHGQAERAEFIRVQVELACIGSPRKAISVSSMEARRDGTGIDCWVDFGQMGGGVSIRAGERVDVQGWSPRSGLADEFSHGLLAVVDMDPSTGWCLLKRDKLSKPYPKNRTDALRRRERELRADHFHQWANMGLSGCALQPPPAEVLPVGHLAAQFRRGFVAAVTCTAAAWWDHGKAIVAAAPVEQVTLSDRRPHEHTLGDWSRRGWAWHSPDSLGGLVAPEHYLPGEWYDFLRGGEESFPRFRMYATAEDAIAAAGAVALSWARKRAGLPALDNLIAERR